MDRREHERLDREIRTKTLAIKEALQATNKNLERAIEVLERRRRARN